MRSDVAEAGELAALLVADRGRADRTALPGQRVAGDRALELRRRHLEAGQVVLLARVGDDVEQLEAPRADQLVPAGNPEHLRLPAEVQVRLHRLADHGAGHGVEQAALRGVAGPAEQRGVDLAKAHRRGACARLDAAAGDHQGHPHDALIEQVAVQRLAVVAAPLAVVGGDDDPHPAGGRRTLEGGEQAPELVVHRRHLALVGVGREAAAERLGRRVRLVRVVVVDPQETRPRLRRRQPGDGAVGRLTRAALDHPGRELVVVALEPARQPELAFERVAGDERSRRVSQTAQPLGEQRHCVRQAAAVLVHAVAAGVEAGQHRRVRRQRRRRGRVGVREAHPACRKCRERRRSRRGVLRRQRIRARGVERHQQQRRPGCRDGRLPRPAPARRREQRQADRRERRGRRPWQVAAEATGAGEGPVAHALPTPRDCRVVRRASGAPDSSE